MSKHNTPTPGQRASLLYAWAGYLAAATAAMAAAVLSSGPAALLLP